MLIVITMMINLLFFDKITVDYILIERIFHADDISKVQNCSTQVSEGIKIFFMFVVYNSLIWSFVKH